MAKTKVTPVGPGPNPNGPPTVRKIKHSAGGSKLPLVNRWWLQPEDQIFQHVQGLLATLETRQSARRFNNARWLRLYSNYDSLALHGGAYARMMPGGGSYASRSYRFTLNVVESCIDAAAAKISKSKPLPRVVTDKGNFKQQKRARNMTKYLKGLIGELDLYTVCQQVFVDGCIWGTGALKIFVENGEIKAKRVMIDDIVVDEEDGRDGDPRQLHQRSLVNRDVLCEMFPEFKNEILRASGSPNTEMFSPMNGDLVSLTESWHLPSGPDADDGLHTICTDNATLFSEKWTLNKFPFAFFRWKPRPLGFYGMGIGEQIAALQVEINKICMLIQESIQRMAKPNVFVQNNSDIIATQISEVVGAIIKTNGPPPTVMVPQAQSAEVYQWLENLYNKAYQITGISQLSAQSQKPAGLNSGAAIREFLDIESTRFELVGQRYEKLFMDVSDLLIHWSRELYQSNPKLASRAKGGSTIESIEWGEADMDSDAFVMEMFPVSSLPNSPEGRLETITQLTQAGYLSKETSFELLDFPDLAEEVSLQVASIQHARMVVDKARWEGKVLQPIPEWNIAAVIELAHQNYLDALQMDTPKSHLDAILDLKDACVAVQEAAAPQPPPPGASAAGGPPLARGPGLPVNPLLPSGAGPGLPPS